MPLEDYNITKFFDPEFTKSIDFTDAYSIPVLMEISEYCNNLRYVILFCSSLAVGFIFISRYIEYRREYLYKMKSESIFIIILF